MAVVYLQALDPERVLGELAASEVPFDSWYSGGMRKLFGFDLAEMPSARSGEFLFAWRNDSPGERVESGNSQRFAVKLNQSRHGYARLVQEVLSEEKHA